MFLNISIYLEGTDLMSTFYNKSLKKVALKYTTINQCSTSNIVKSDNYLISLSIHNDTPSDNFRNNTYKVYVPSIYSWW